jgi:hypothetical protein
MHKRRASTRPGAFGGRILWVATVAFLGLVAFERSAEAQANFAIEKFSVGFCDGNSNSVQDEGEFNCTAPGLPPIQIPGFDPTNCPAVCNVTQQCGEPATALLVVQNQGEPIAPGVPGGNTFRLVLAWDVIDPAGVSNGPIILPPGGGPESVLPVGCTAVSSDASCAVPNLDILFAAGNTTCQAGGDLPCQLCAADPGSLVDACGAAPPNQSVGGTVVFVSDDYVIQENDVPTLADQAFARFFNLCDRVPAGCNSTVLDGGQRNATRPVTCPGEGVGNFKCYAAKPAAGTSFPRRTVVLEDQFGDTTAQVVSPLELCTPVNKVGIEEEEPDLLHPDNPHLMCYKLQNASLVPPVDLRDTDQFGSEELRVRSPSALCQPALKNCVPDPEAEPPVVCDLEATQQALSHFECYQASPETLGLPDGVPYAPPATLDLFDQFGTTVTDVEGTRFHCNPVFAKNEESLPVALFPDPIGFPVPEGVESPQDVHYKCYDVEDQEAAFVTQTVSVEDQFGTRSITIGAATRLCEPAVKEVAANNDACGLGPELLGLLPLLHRLRRRRGQGGAALR